MMRNLSENLSIFEELMYFVILWQGICFSFLRDLGLSSAEKMLSREPVSWKRQSVPSERF